MLGTEAAAAVLVDPVEVVELLPLLVPTVGALFAAGAAADATGAGAVVAGAELGPRFDPEPDEPDVADGPRESEGPPRPEFPDGPPGLDPLLPPLVALGPGPD